MRGTLANVPWIIHTWIAPVCRELTQHRFLLLLERGQSSQRYQSPGEDSQELGHRKSSAVCMELFEGAEQGGASASKCLLSVSRVFEMYS